jgi:hypothetical protein
MTARYLLKKNYKFNKPGLTAIVVKILGRPFTIPTTFADVVRAMSRPNQIGRSLRVPIAYELE